MSTPLRPSKVLFFASVLYRSDLHKSSDLKQTWESLFSDSLEAKFDHCPMKSYYSKEMGDEQLLERRFYVSTKPLDRERLVEFKAESWEWEGQSLVEHRRTVNWDIGYVSLENMVLATGKPYSHRLYLGEGVFGELTYEFVEGEFRSLKWTYPDYSHIELAKFFVYIRSLLVQALKA